MKRILICSHAMEIGGAERALLGLLNSLDYQNYTVDLFLCRCEGELKSLIPREVNILPMNKARYLAIPIIKLVKELQIKMLYGRLKAKILAIRTVRDKGLSKDNQVELTYSHKYTYKYIERINPDIEYDLSISFLTPHYICINKVNAKKYISWIHTDYSNIDIDKEVELDMWSKYDYIISISEKCTESFINKFPGLKNKIVRVDNIVTKNIIQKQSDMLFNHKEMDKKSIKLLSVGRFSYAKNFDNIPEICKYVVESGLNVKWYLIGFGVEEQLIKSKIKEYNMQEHIFILGKKNNPYPYIKDCDIYIQPSRYEGKAVAVREAQILQKPVIITNFPTAKSQLVEGIDGIIVPMNNKECANGIVDLIKDKKLQNTLITNIKNIDYSNEDEIKKIYKLMED